MPSYQDIETRLAQVERMIQFTMNAIGTENPLNPFGPPQTLLQTYRQVLGGKTLGEAVGETPKTEEKNGTDATDAPAVTE